jgi:hypothetical protein
MYTVMVNLEWKVQLAVQVTMMWMQDIKGVEPCPLIGLGLVSDQEI